MSPLRIAFLFVSVAALSAACTESAPEPEIDAQDLTTAATAAPLLPDSYRAQTFAVERPLVLEYSFGGAASNRARLNVVNYPGGTSDLFFFHMHANEKTSKRAGEAAVRANGGTFMYLTHSTEEREMVVSIGARRYRFDPNRIFTALGLEEKTEPRPTGSDLTALRRFVEWVKANIALGRAQRARPMVTALHNNTDDDAHGRLLSILTEQDLIGVDNASVSRNPAWDIDDFYIATLPSTYDAIIASFNPNISLRRERPRDIGYLSNWMITEGIDYLNVETQLEDTAGNRTMVENVQRLFH